MKEYYDMREDRKNGLERLKETAIWFYIMKNGRNLL